jgi:hypothetical protein
MAVVTLNGVRVDTENEYVKDFKNGKLNMMLGEDGLPKYTANQLKSLKKVDLLAEVQPLIDAAVAASVVPSPTTEHKKRGAKRKPAKNKASAQSKKCLLLRDVASHKITVDEAIEILADDPLLGKEMNRTDIENAWNTERRPGGPLKSRRTLTVEITNETIELAANERMNERGDIIADSDTSWAG